MHVRFLHHRCEGGQGSSILADPRAEKEGKELEIAKETQKLNWLATCVYPGTQGTS